MDTPLERAANDAEVHRQNLSETLDQLDERLEGWMSGMRDQLKAPERWIRRHPLIAASALVAVGFVVGSRLQEPGPLKKTGPILKNLPKSDETTTL